MTAAQRASRPGIIMRPMDAANLPRRRARRGTLYLLILLILVIGGGSLWTWLTLAWAYADGTRAGVLQKFTHRGWICKTQEGELAQYVVAGVLPQMWQFSVRDPAIGAKLERLVGARVQLHYTEHPGVPTGCFADTRYFVDGVTVIDAGPAAPSPMVPGSPGPGSAVLPASPRPATPLPATPLPATPPPATAPSPP